MIRKAVKGGFFNKVAKLEGENPGEETESDLDNSLSGMAVASAALKGVSGRLMDKLKGKKENET